MADLEREDLVGGLARLAAAGEVDADVALPALDELAGDGPPVSAGALLGALEEEDSSALRRLVGHLRDRRWQEASRSHQHRQGRQGGLAWEPVLLDDLPAGANAGWRQEQDARTTVESALRLLRDRALADSRREAAPVLAGDLDQRFEKAAASVADLLRAAGPELMEELIARWTEEASPDPRLLVALAEVRRAVEEERGERIRAARQALRELPEPGADLPEVEEGAALAVLRERWTGAATREEKRAVLDVLFCWPGIPVTTVLADLTPEPWAAERAGLILVLRFGRQIRGWGGWTVWLRQCAALVAEQRRELRRLAAEHPGELLRIWLSCRAGVAPDLVQALDAHAREQTPLPSPEDLAERWRARIPGGEWNVLLGRRPRTVPPPPPPAPPATRPAAERLVTAVSEAAESAAEKKLAVRGAAAIHARHPEPDGEPEGPSLWHDYIQYLVAGVVMVLVGSSLLAYYSWDKHWLLRYTVMPLLLGGFTAALAGVASWFERQDERLADTAVILRGTAIGLLPVNFMAVALLSGDDQVAAKALAVPLVGAAYLAFFGFALRRWCAAVHPALRTLLGGTLLALNSLVVLGPLARTVARLDDRALAAVLVAGFYLGFFALAAAVLRFTRRVLDRELAAARSVPWFFGITLALTFLQVFAWVHGSLSFLPPAATYGPMVILAGALVLAVERRSLELRDESERHGTESFLGFALILLGTLMTLGEPPVRVLGLLLAGAAWLDQNRSRRAPLHHAIGLAFVTLGGAAIGLLDGFPSAALPALGIALAVAVTRVGRLAEAAPPLPGGEGGRRDRGRRARVAVLLQTAILVLTATVAALVQWQDRSEPWITAAYLLVIAAFFGVRAGRDQDLRWLHTTMAVLALSLPYLGFVDVGGNTLRGNTLVFGLALLSLLWLGLIRAVGSPLLRSARSTVLWLYGSLAVAAMALRVLIERDVPPQVLRWQDFMDFSGPLLMVVVLAIATYTSRSLVPAIMATAIGAVLYPSLRASFEMTFPGLGWGSGLGSAASASGLIVLCYFLRRAAFLKELGPGDLYLGENPFPFRLHDHRLFTWPLTAAVLFLTVKVETWNLLRNLSSDGLPPRTCLALVLTAAVWTLLGAFHHRSFGAVLGTHLGWLWLLVGTSLGLPHVFADPHWTWSLLATGLVLQILYLVYRQVLVPRFAWAEDQLLAPTRAVLRVGGLLLAALLFLALLAGAGFRGVVPLLLFVAVQLAWHGLASRRPVHGAFLALLTVAAVLAATSPGRDLLVDRLSVYRSLMPTLWLVLGILALHLGLEARKEWHERLAPLLRPALLVGTVLAVLVGCLAIRGAVGPEPWSASPQILLFVVVLLAARAQASAPLALLATALAYLLVHYGPLGRASEVREQMYLLFGPWRCSLLAFAMVALGHAGTAIGRRRPGWLAGPYPMAIFRSTSDGWFFVPALSIATLAALAHLVEPVWRTSAAQLPAPYIGAVAVGWIARRRARRAGARVLDGIAVVLATLGNIHLVWFYLVAPLEDAGLSLTHVICLGLAATLLQSTLLRRFTPAGPFHPFDKASLSRAELALAAGVLALLATNYFVHPSLGDISWLRFLVSGAMALLAGLYFRHAARSPEAEPGHADVAAGLYHFGLTLALWCAALLVPWLRRPATALAALGVPVVVFYLRAEIGLRVGETWARRYRQSAAVLGFVVLALYVFRFFFHLVLFPDLPVDVDHYHHGSLVVMLLALVLLRLHGLGGTGWLAFYGGLALVGGSYFALTGLPGLSPFRQVVAGTWCAVALAHFWTAVTHHRSPLRTAIQDLAGLDFDAWIRLRRSWGFWLLLATQAIVLRSLFAAEDSLALAPLLLGGASVLLHIGLIRESALYLALAGLEFVAALHMDVFAPSYLGIDHVLWAVLATWAVLLVLAAALSRRLEPTWTGAPAAALALVTLGHVFYHDPGSRSGLLGVFLGAVLAASGRRRSRRSESADEQLAAALLLVVPTWLTFHTFGEHGVAPFGEHGVARTLLATALAVLFTGAAAILFQTRLRSRYETWSRARPRLLDHTLTWIGEHGSALHGVTLWIASLVTVAVQLLHYDRPYAVPDLFLIAGLYAALASAWYAEGRRLGELPGVSRFRATIPWVALQLSVLAFFAVFRRQLMLTTDFWSYEYDVWTSLAVSFGLAGARQLLDLRPRAVRLPFLGTLAVLPVVALVWVLVHGLGVDVALVVVGLHSLMFAYMGKDERESPYHLVAVAGFVGFVAMVFWAKLELRVLHAYTVPAGIGILVLLHLFEPRIPALVRHRIRLVTLLVMLGSAGYYALVDDRFPMAFHLTLIVLSLLAMVLGTLLRVALYLTLGFAALMADLASIVYKVLGQMERSTRMTTIGSLVLLLGIGLVFGAAWYKTHQDELNERIDGWRRRLAGWE